MKGGPLMLDDFPRFFIIWLDFPRTPELAFHWIWALREWLPPECSYPVPDMSILRVATLWMLNLRVDPGILRISSKMWEYPQNSWIHLQMDPGILGISSKTRGYPQNSWIHPQVDMSIHTSIPRVAALWMLTSTWGWIQEFWGYPVKWENILLSGIT